MNVFLQDNYYNELKARIIELYKKKARKPNILYK
jgi:hypothetical protein